MASHDAHADESTGTGAFDDSLHEALTSKNQNHMATASDDRSTTPPPPPLAAVQPLPTSLHSLEDNSGVAHDTGDDMADTTGGSIQDTPTGTDAAADSINAHAGNADATTGAVSDGPSFAHASFLDRTGLGLDGDKASDSFHDAQYRMMNDSLPGVESSFVAPLSPLPTITQDGPDDTYLFDSPRKRQQPAAAPAPGSLPPDAGEPQTQVQPSSAQDEDSLLWPPDAQQQQQQQTAPRDDSRRRSLNLNESTGSGGSNGLALRYGKRPRFLRSRNASQRSSASSFITNPDTHDAHDAREAREDGGNAHDDVDSDVTVGLGADYALQSGGAIPVGGRRNASDLLSRAVSMGSVASSALGGGSETLEDNDHDGHHNSEELLRTPRPNKATLAPPTDTVLTRRVMDIQVPESLAREYKTRNGLMTPRKPSDFRSEFGSTTATATSAKTAAANATSTTTGTRPGRNMTLKEQSSTIERLSKENFDLKLKVMFLSDRLDKLSEDGIKEMIQENVEFRTNIAILQRDNKGLRRRVKELEKKIRDEDDNNNRPGTSRSGNSSNGLDDPEAAAAADQEREEEVLYLRERVEEFTNIIEQLRQDVFTKEAEKRRMGDMIKSLQSSSTDKNTGETLGRQEEEDVWKDLLEQETARREQADDDNRKLRDEIFRLKQEMHSSGAGATGTVSSNGNGVGERSLHHTTNIYNISKRAANSNANTNANAHAVGGDTDGASASTGSNTLVEELRREGEQLRHENAELRKEVGAQTSMLTSRNREKERLYQEIEDLKMAQRRGGGPAPSTIDSLLDRSASQIGMGVRERSGSRASGGTRADTVVGGTATGAADEQDQYDRDAAREDLENRNAALRDKINEAKLENQTLLQELEATLLQKQEAEEVALGVQKDYEGAMTDLMAMQAERDELIAELNDLEQKHSNLQGEFEDLRAEAQDAIDGYEEEADLRDAENQKLQTELAEKTENFGALQDEMRKLSEALVGLEDETENKVRRVQQLEQELGDANKELEELEAKLLESNDKAQRLLVQQENSQGEIAFLREEQESDKINISRLEVSITKAEEQIRDEQERVKQLQAQIVTERERSESLATKDKKEMQQFVNELSREASGHKEEARKLRKSLTSREVEATEWKERLMELENNMREALGDLNGTRSSLLKSIAQIQRELENSVRELQTTKGNLMEKDRIIKQRDALLESHGLEARKVADALEKERAAHRNTKHQFDTFQKTHQHVTRTVTTQDARITELESSKTLDKRRMSQLESTFRDQLTERNNLLLLLWTRLSAICGTDWAHDNSLINGRALPSLEVVATMLSGFTRNLMAAIKHIEAVVGGFPGRIKAVERDLWREYQSLESTLDQRVKRLDRLEAVVRNTITGAGPGGSNGSSSSFGTPELQSRFLRLEDAYRQLKVENTTLRAANDVRARVYGSSSGNGDGSNGGTGLGIGGSSGVGTDTMFDLPGGGGSPSPSIPTGPRDRSAKSARGKSGRSGVPRPITSSSSSGAHLSLTSASSRPLTAGELALHEGEDTGSGAGGGADPRWILRLRDLENKLKLEREGRTMDRNEAVRRLREQEAELARRSERDKRLGRED
ncbi:hypothetical protein HMPREF1624_03981 [Sporothrix schenckii ATCC 58251]|uniref:Uncharacterized protein n=1 Tax=Sporothrix schenckii (strain ATCC 58251 / de Perez 2211183) TaxID=1391915 RepID=U7PV10_SPOS1|nr:hypothetical protein HMPREF1624_03981 [Sporothrix schenckii ATCC 58251]